MKNLGIGFEGLGTIGVIGAACYFGYQCVKMYKTSKKLDMTLDELSAKQPVDIQQAVVDKAIENAVDRQVRSAVNEATNRLRSQIRSDMNEQIRKDVNAAYDEMKTEVSKRIADDVAAIDSDALKRQVTKKAEEKILQRFDGSLDGLLDKMNHNLSNVTKIYDGISSVMSGSKNSNNGRELTFHLD